MKIGILGGTFNPIHNGHLINAQIIKEDYSLNTVIFLPTKDPVHKTLDDGVSPENRFEMIKLAIYDNNGFDASRIEIDRDSESYTITTLKQLIGMNKGNKLYLIVGYDTFEQIETWKDYEKVLKMVSLIVMKRPGEPIYNEKILNMASEVLFANNPFIEISSSHIRKRIIEGKPIKYFVPGRVEEYIINKGLYKN